MKAPNRLYVVILASGKWLVFHICRCNLRVRLAIPTLTYRLVGSPLWWCVLLASLFFLIILCCPPWRIVLHLACRRVTIWFWASASLCALLSHIFLFLMYLKIVIVYFWWRCDVERKKCRSWIIFIWCCSICARSAGELYTQNRI